MHNIMRKAALSLLAGAAVMTMTLLAAGSAGATAAAPAAPAAHASAALKWPTTGPGSKGERVFAIQYLLNQRINAKLGTDGIYGPKTTAAVKAFQKKVKLPVDGIVGPMTYPKLIFTVKKGNKGPAAVGDPGTAQSAAVHAEEPAQVHSAVGAVDRAVGGELPP